MYIFKSHIILHLACSLGKHYGNTYLNIVVFLQFCIIIVIILTFIVRITLYNFIEVFTPRPTLRSRLMLITFAMTVTWPKNDIVSQNSFTIAFVVLLTISRALLRRMLSSIELALAPTTALSSAFAFTFGFGSMSFVSAVITYCIMAYIYFNTK